MQPITDDILNEILNDKENLPYFKKTVKEMHASELLNFYMEVQIFKSMDDMELLIRKAKRIYDKYFQEKSEYEINVDANIKQHLKSAFDYGIWDKTLFDEALREVLYLLQRNCLPVYLKLGKPVQRSSVPLLLTMRRRPKPPIVTRSHSNLSMEQYLQIIANQKKQSQRTTSPQWRPSSPPSTSPLLIS